MPTLKGGTIQQIASDYGVTPEELQRLNPNLNTNTTYSIAEFNLPQQSITGDPNYDALLGSLESYLSELQKRGQVINPNIQITPEQLAEFTKKAEGEIDPYYGSQLKLARESFLRNQGYSVQQLQDFEKNLETQYGRATRQLGESAAEQGFALSGIRQRQEQELAQDTQRQLDLTRQQAQFQAGTQARQFAQQYGGLQGQALPTTPTLGEAPRVLAGQGAFQRSGRDLPFYELSPDVYSGLIGEQEFGRRGAITGRASELEQAERTKLGLAQQRNLIF